MFFSISFENRIATNKIYNSIFKTCTTYSCGRFRILCFVLCANLHCKYRHNKMYGVRTLWLKMNVCSFLEHMHENNTHLMWVCMRFERRHIVIFICHEKKKTLCSCMLFYFDADYLTRNWRGSTITDRKVCI